MTQPKRILVIQTAFFGDVVLSTPLVAALKNNIPQADISILVRPRADILLQNNPHLDEVLVYDKRGKDRGLSGFQRITTELRKRDFDTAICLQRSMRSALLAYRAKIPKRIGFSGAGGTPLYTARIQRDPAKHQIQRYLDLAGPLGLEKDSFAPHLYPGEPERERVRAYLAKNNIPEGQAFAVLAPGSIWATKRWPIENYRELALHLGADVPVILVGAPDERDLGQAITKNMDTSLPVLNSMGEVGLLDTAALLKQAAVCVSNDSVNLHIASAMQRPTVGIFGPTHPSQGFAPFGKNAAIAQLEDLPCRSCSAHGNKECPLAHFRCMRQLSVAQVEKAVRAFF